MVEHDQNPLEGSTPEALEAVNSLNNNDEAQELNGSERLESEVSNEPESVDLAEKSEEPALELAPQEHAPAAEAPVQDVPSVESESEEYQQHLHRHL